MFIELAALQQQSAGVVIAKQPTSAMKIHPLAVWWAPDAALIALKRQP
jgi:hypothetical protein